MTNERKLSPEAKTVFDMLESSKIGMFVTGGGAGDPMRSRPMSFVEIDRTGMVIRMFSNLHSMKDLDLAKDNRANISFMDTSHQKFVSLSGLVSMTQEPKLKMRLWNPIHLAWFPDGPDDKDLVVLEFKIVGGDYWDAPGNKLVQVFGIAKAILTGKVYDQGKVGHMGSLH